MGTEPDSESETENLFPTQPKTYPLQVPARWLLAALLVAAGSYVTYNDINNDHPGASAIAEEIINKVIMPNARSFCRLRGSNASGRDFIGGETRTAFQADFQAAIRRTCEKQGIEIVQALITRIKPPNAIAGPVREREIALQELSPYQQQELQQQQEAHLAVETALITQGQKLVDADREVVVLTTAARQRQSVALAAARRDLEVAAQHRLAAHDRAEAVLAAKHVEAAVITFANRADAAGWRKAVQALDNDGEAYARYLLYQKLAPSFKSISDQVGRRRSSCQGHRRPHRTIGSDCS